MNYSAFALQAKQEKTYRWSHTGGRDGWAGAGWLVGDWGVVGVEVGGGIDGKCWPQAGGDISSGWLGH